MFFRIRIALGLAVLLTLITSITAFAKGAFSFIAVTGANLKEEVRVTDPALTTDFFAFADFFQNKIEVPANPGAGYDITRYYIDGKREIAFDRLHYYPESGFVFYDGIVNGSSEYDGKWYTAKPEIKTVFENALSVSPFPKSQPIQSNDQVKSGASIDPTQSTINIAQPQFFVSIAIIAGLAVMLLLALRRRKVTAQ